MPYRLIPRRLRDRIGRRGIVLLLFGTAWLVQGAAFFLLSDMYAGHPRYFVVDRTPLWTQGALWVASGAVSVAASLRTRRESDSLGFLAVSGPPMVYGFSYFVGAITYGIAGNPLWLLGALGFSVWGPIILALTVVASWPEPATPTEAVAGE